MAFDLIFPRASKFSLASGVIKTSEDDFYVKEIMQVEMSGEGEHVWLWVEKIGQNTEFVAGQIADFANVKKMDVGFSGQKDRWAKTQQWFSVYLGSKVEPDWQAFEVENVSILEAKRHSKKLRRGEHQSNYFNIFIRNLADSASLEKSLIEIQGKGFPNYFGPQRFGRKGANLERGERFFNGEIKASRSQRSFYLSAARSYLFNLNLAKAVKDDTWIENEIGGPLYGDAQDGVAPLSAHEQYILEHHAIFAKGIHKNRLKLERRPYCIVPENMSWEFEGEDLRLSFTLPKGIFATALLAEACEFKTALGEN